jgi:hypothetical protein
LLAKVYVSTDRIYKVLTINFTLIGLALRTWKRSLLVRESTINDFVTILFQLRKRRREASYKEIVIFYISCLSTGINAAASWVAARVKGVLL